MDLDPLVSLVGSSFVYPFTPTTKHCLLVPFGDAVWMDAPHNQCILFYPTGNRIHYPSLVSNLRHGLSLVLNHYYMWAGRLAKLEDGSVVIDCNDAGVEFLEAVCPDIPLDFLERFEFQQQPLFFSKLVPLGHKTLIHDLDLPLLSVQVTRFADGGVAIGVADSHVLTDGISFWMFMNSWAECCRSVPISTFPVHMRSIVEHPKIVKTEKCEAIPDKHHDGPKLLERVFQFSSEAIKKLKQLSTDNGEGPYSTLECLCAHMWKRLTAARGVGGEQKLRLSILANTRRRLVPQLPDAYFGNAITPVRVSATAGELLRKENLATTARRIHENIFSCNDATINAFQESIKNMDPHEAFRPDSDVIGTTVVNSPKIPAYELDFGSGRPAAVRIAKIWEDGIIMLFPGRGGGASVDVTIALPAEVMHKLEADSEFSYSSCEA